MENNQSPDVLTAEELAIALTLTELSLEDRQFVFDIFKAMTTD